MKRYSFLVYHKQYTEFLEKIRDIGVLHVIEKPEGIAENDTLRLKLLLASRIKSAIKQLEKRIPKNATLAEAKVNESGLEVLEKTEHAISNKDVLEQQLLFNEKERERMEVWGVFSHKKLEQLQKSGFELKFYSCNLRKFDPEWEVKFNAFEIDTIGSTRYFITITPSDQIVDIEADQVKLSNKTAQQLDEVITEIRTLLDNNKTELIQLSINDYATLKALEARILSDIDFSKVYLNTQTEASEKVMVLEGYCPEEMEENLNSFLDNYGTYYEATIPNENDKVPIKLKNNAFAKLYEMIGELYDIPNYHEIDLTPFFAPFYMLFFGLCLGDAGYGLLFVLVAIIARPKVKPNLKPILSLVIWLGSSTVIMGIVSGTFFGYNLLESKIEWIEKFKVVMLDANQLFNTALILGCVQIMFAMIIKAVGLVRRYGLAASLSTWGWIIVILGGGAVFGLSKLYPLQPETIKWAYLSIGAIGVLLIFILNNLKRNPLINIGAGIWDTYNMATGLLGDVLSYIRLFALGISGAVMGFVFNDLAIQLSGNIPVLSPIIMIIIMIIGHGINIFMSSLSAFVHPMRLTFVEFYKNSGFEGGGKKYKPFAPYKEKESLF